MWPGRGEGSLGRARWENDGWRGWNPKLRGLQILIIFILLIFLIILLILIFFRVTPT